MSEKDSKHITVDFVCQKNLALTTLKEFLEIFLTSIRNEDTFHTELMGEKHLFIGLNLDFNQIEAGKKFVFESRDQKKMVQKRKIKM